MTVTTIDYIQVDDAAGIARDVTGKMYRIVTVPEPVLSSALLATPGVSSSGTSQDVTITPASGKTAYLTGFDLSIPAVVTLLGATMTISGLSVADLQFRISALTTGTFIQWRAPDGAIAASAANTAIVLHVPAITAVVTAANLYGKQL